MKLNIILRTHFLILILLLESVYLFGANNIQFYNINEEYGLSIRQTNKVCSDNNDFIWISSKMGVVRFTQEDVKTYQLPYETVDIISLSLVYESCGLYAYTNNGQVFKYNPIMDDFELIVSLSSVLRNAYILVNEVLVDNIGDIWLATSIGLFHYNTDTGLKVLGNGEDIQFIEWYDSTHFFYATSGQIRIYNINNNSSSEYFTFNSNVNYYVSSMYYDKVKNTLWIGTFEDGLFSLSEDNGFFTLLLFDEIPKQPILDIELNKGATLLVCIDGQGLWEIDYVSNEVLNVFKEDADNPKSLRGNGVYDVFVDKNNRVWVCTYSGGVSYFDQTNSKVQVLQHISNNNNSLVNNDVNCVLEDKDNQIWFATNNGISVWNRSSNKWKTIFHNKKEQAQVYLSLCEDNQGRIWAGTYSSGVYLIDQKTGRELNHFSVEDSDGNFASNFVFDIIKDQEGNIWNGGVRGDLVCYKAKEDTFVSFEGITVNVMNDYSPDKLLIGTTYGLLTFNKSTGDTETLVEGFLVYDIIIKGNVVWLCTSGEGVIKYDLIDKDIEQITVDSGLPSNFVNSIEYYNGYFWIGTESGICKLDENDNSIVTYNTIPEITNVSFNQNSQLKLSNGNLIWGTNKGVIVFNADDIKTQEFEGKIFIQDLSISGRSIRDISKGQLDKPVDSVSNISLKYSQNTISLELLPIGISSSGSKFSWKLEGVDQEWSIPRNNRIISYSKMPIGDFKLRIRMYDDTLSKLIDERVLEVGIIPPYWKSWWFNILILIVVGGIGISLFKYYIYRLKEEHSQEKIRFFANTAHDIRTSLTLINGPIEELNKEPGLSDKALHYLFLATDQTRRLLKVVTQLMDFQKVDVGKEIINLAMHDVVKVIQDRIMMFESYAKSNNIVLNFETNVESFSCAFDELMIEKIVDNLISNGIKYSCPDVNLFIKLQCTGNKWILEVEDQGIGISKKAQKSLFNEYYRGENAVNSKVVGSGIGLLLVKNYVQLHKGKISCVSQENKGSVFQVVIPVIKSKELTANQGVSNVPMGTWENEEKSFSIHKPNDIQSSESSKMKVLVVEDNDYLREFLKSALESQFQVLISENGVEAWEIIQKELPDLVVSDIMMPKMDGFELCSKLKGTYETSHIPIILLTSLSEKTEELKGLGLGADDYLIKPFDVTILQQRIKSIIQNRDIIRNRALKVIKYTESDEEIISENHLNDQFIKRMVEVVRENMANSSFSKDEFASKMNVSSSLLYKKIKSLTDLSPTDFIKSIRLDYSLELLQSKKYSITEISEMCGFSSVGYFSTVFRKNYGKSPSQLM